MSKINLFWFRRDLRLEDNAGLYRALTAGLPVLPVFIFDKSILEKLPEKNDARVEFIHTEITRLAEELAGQGSAIVVRHGYPEQVWTQLAEEFEVANVFTNHDYEPYAKDRDAAVKKHLESKGIGFHTFKDHVIFENLEVAKDDGEPYVVFTPYSRKWRDKMDSEIVKNHDGSDISFFLKSYPTENYFSNFHQSKQGKMPSLAEMGFEKSDIEIPSRTVAQGLVRSYDKTRDYPAMEGTSRLGIHFRFGTISIREKARKALNLNQVFLNELIWRDFYAQILANFPHVATGPFREKYERIEWRNNEAEFEAWCQGRTGYPLVDAGMRELNQTGFMHNRVRMVTASFLTKHLLINWQWGEAYFAEKLLDFDLASNNGGWQWAAGCGTDAAPYFRIFNPASQLEKFDKQKKYVKQWVPEFGTADYPEPIVEHKMARERCLKVYKEGLDG